MTSSLFMNSGSQRFTERKGVRSVRADERSGALRNNEKSEGAVRTKTYQVKVKDGRLVLSSSPKRKPI